MHITSIIKPMYKEYNEKWNKEYVINVYSSLNVILLYHHIGLILSKIFNSYCDGEELVLIIISVVCAAYMIFRMYINNESEGSNWYIYIYTGVIHLQVIELFVEEKISILMLIVIGMMVPLSIIIKIIMICPERNMIHRSSIILAPLLMTLSTVLGKIVIGLTMREYMKIYLPLLAWTSCIVQGIPHMIERSRKKHGRIMENQEKDVIYAIIGGFRKRKNKRLF